MYRRASVMPRGQAARVRRVATLSSLLDVIEA
jgi:hypothetical protein